MRRKERERGGRVRLTLAFFIAAGALRAAAGLSLTEARVAPGSSAVLSLRFSAQGAQVAAVQFDADYERASMSLKAALGAAARGSRKSIRQREIGPNRQRILIAGLTRDSIADGEIARLFVGLSDNAGEIGHAIVLTNVVASDPEGRPVALGSSAGTIVVDRQAGDTVRLRPEGVLNGASLLPGPIAPGEVITLFGSNIGPANAWEAATDGAPSDAIRILFDGQPAPLLYASVYQINAIVPFGVHGQTASELRVIRGDQVIAELTLPVGEAAIGLFASLDGTGPAIALHPDGSMNSHSNAAAKGSDLIFYATGGGLTEPESVDAEIAGEQLPVLRLPVRATIGGVEAEVLSAGAATGLIAGMLQVKCRVPPGIDGGHAVPVQFSVGSVYSQPGVTVSID